MTEALRTHLAHASPNHMDQLKTYKHFASRLAHARSKDSLSVPEKGWAVPTGFQFKFDKAVLSD